MTVDELLTVLPLPPGRGDVVPALCAACPSSPPAPQMKSWNTLRPPADAPRAAWARRAQAEHGSACICAWRSGWTWPAGALRRAGIW